MTSSGKRHGFGEYNYTDSSSYVGNWDYDMISGEGTHHYANGDR